MTDTDTQTPPAGPSKPKTKRWIKIALGVSLAANLLVIGAIGGVAWRIGGAQGSKSGPVARGGDRGGIALIRAMPPQERRAMFQALRAASPSSKPDAAASLQAVIDVLRTSPLDESQLKALTDARYTEGIERQQQLSEVWMAQIVSMSPDARARYATRLENHLKKGPRKAKK